MTTDFLIQVYVIQSENKKEICGHLSYLCYLCANIQTPYKKEICGHLSYLCYLCANLQTPYCIFNVLRSEAIEALAGVDFREQ